MQWRPALDVAIPGLYAWVVTIALPVRQLEAHGWALLASWISLLSLTATSAISATPFRRWSPIAVAVFLGASALVWFLIEPFEASLGLLGSIGWASFAVGWIRAAATREELDVSAARAIELAPRHPFSVLAGVFVGVALIGAVVLVFLAFRIEGRERALLGQAVAVMGTLSLLTIAASSSATFGRKAAARSFSAAQLGRTLALAGLLLLGCWLTYRS